MAPRSGTAGGRGTLDVVRRRLAAHRLAWTSFASPVEVVRWFGAVQAQDYLGALWAVGLRTRGAVEADVERALAERAIVRTWPMRGTLHFVPAEDTRWMLRLLTPRVLERSKARERQLGLGAKDFARSRKLLAKALDGGRQLTRDATYAVLERGGVSPAGQRGIHVVGRLAQEGFLCYGARDGKQQTFALLDAWVPPSSSRDLAREEALAELALRYFTGHGPALLRDLVWWSGLPAADAREALALAAPRLAREEMDGETYWLSPDAPEAPRAARAKDEPPLCLLPPFDEWLVGYRDRDDVLDPAHRDRIGSLLSPTIVDGGRVTGTWGRRLAKGKAAVTASFFERKARPGARALHGAVERYRRFVGATVAELCVR